MKALEKAAKDREGNDATASAGTSKDGIALEPMPARAAAPRDAAPAQQPARSNAAAETAKQPAQAATVMKAGRSGSSAAGGILRTRPLFVFSLLAGLCAAGYGGYVYLQLTNPALFAKQAPRQPQNAQISPPPPVAPAVTTSVPVQPSTPLASLALPETEPAQAAQPAQPAQAAGAAGKGVASAPPAIPLTSIATAIKTATSVATQTTAAVALTRDPLKTAAAAQPAANAPAPVVGAPLPQAPLVPAAESARETIKVTAGSTTPVINPLLTEAYTALNAGNLDASQRLYNQMLRSDPGSVDALLGLAAIATQQNNSDEATRRYLKVLELDPRNALAQAGLIGILGRADPQSSESRIKQLITREPAAAYLHFALGITYVDQKRWPDAQQSFFQAHQLQPDNPDYAFNLAVALEHIGQPKAALDYYRRAVQLAAIKGRTNFSTVAAEDRIGKLEKVAR